jgi:hypothetical protein
MEITKNIEVPSILRIQHEETLERQTKNGPSADILRVGLNC